MIDLLTSKTYIEPRTPKQLYSWIELIKSEAAKTKHEKNQSNLHEGLYKQLMEELYPISCYCSNIYEDREGVSIMPVLGNQNFDAIIRDNDKNIEYNIEVTCSIDGYDRRLRMEHFVQYGTTSFSGKPPVRIANGEVRRLGIDDIDFDESSLLRQSLFSRVMADFQKKQSKKYESGTVLLIYFDDFLSYRFDDPDDRNELLEFFVNKKIKLFSFNSVYFIGASRKTCIQMPVV